MPEYPGISPGSPADHYGVTPRLLLHFARLLGGGYISVSDYGNRELFFDLTDKIPGSMNLKAMKKEKKINNNKKKKKK